MYMNFSICCLKAQLSPASFHELLRLDRLSLVLAVWRQVSDSNHLRKGVKEIFEQRNPLSPTPIPTYKFSKLISIHFFKELVERIGLKIKAFSLSRYFH